MTSQETSRRLTVQEAAEVLGTSVDAVRMRVRRGSLDSEKESDGRVYVYLGGDSSETKHQLDGEPAALISAKDETIAVLREQLRAEREAHGEARRIIAGLVQRVPELESPASPDRGPGQADRAAAGPGNGAVPEDRETGFERPWWRRMFGG